MEDRGSSPFASVCRRFGCVTGQRDGTAHVSFPEPGTSVRGSRAETAPTETRFPGADGGFRTKREGMKHPLRVRLSGPSGCGTDPRLAVARWTCLPLRIALFFGRRTAAPFGVGRSVGSAGCGCLGSRSSNGKVCQARRRRAPSGSPDDSASAGNRATPPGGRSVVIRHLAPDRQEPPQAETTVLQWVGSPWEHRATRRLQSRRAATDSSMDQGLEVGGVATGRASALLREGSSAASSAPDDERASAVVTRCGCR